MKRKGKKFSMKIAIHQLISHNRGWISEYVFTNLLSRYKCLSRICCIIVLFCFILFSDHIIISNDSVQPSSSVEFDDSAIINSSKVVYSSSSIITSTFYPSLNINETTAQQNQSDLHSKCTRNQEFENRYSPYTIPWSTIKH